MYRAPAVTWDVKPARWHARAVGLVLLCATLLMIGFVSKQTWSTTTVILLAAFVYGVLFALYCLHSAPSGKLSWDGERWHWSGWEAQDVSAMVCGLDLQSMVLVRIRGKAGAGQWLWLECHSPGTQWIALRRALFAGSSAAQPAPADESYGGQTNVRQ